MVIPNNIDAEKIITIAESIENFGVVSVITAVYILITSGLLLFCVRWFKQLIDSIIKNSKTQQQRVDDNMTRIIAEEIKQNEMLSELTGLLRPEALSDIKDYVSLHFDYTVVLVCRLIRDVRTENNIKNHVVTERKVRLRLTNIHEHRNNRFTRHKYRDKRLDEYCSPEWIDAITKVVLEEIYNQSGPNEKREEANVKAAYDMIKMDLYKRLED